MTYEKWFCFQGISILRILEFLLAVEDEYCKQIFNVFVKKPRLTDWIGTSPCAHCKQIVRTEHNFEQPLKRFVVDKGLQATSVQTQRAKIKKYHCIKRVVFNVFLSANYIISRPTKNLPTHAPQVKTHCIKHLSSTNVKLPEYIR